MMKSMQPSLLNRLKIYYEELLEYKELEGNRLALTTEEHKRHKFLREKLLRESQIFKDKIIELTNYRYIKVKGETYDIWIEAFDNNFFSVSKWPSIDHCIDSTNIAIGKLESIELSKTRNYSSLSTPQEITSYLFDKMQLHPEIITASKSLFETGHYAEAIFEAFKAIENFVREKTGLHVYGKQLMSRAFNEDDPLIQVTEAGRIDKDVQEGFKFLFMGATVGIRNPKAHHRIIQRDPFITLEYLGFASFLLKRIAGWQVNQRKQE